MVRGRSSLAVAMVCSAAAAWCLVPRRIWCTASIGVSFVGTGGVDGQVVFVAGAGHPDVGHRARSAVRQHGPAHPGVRSSPTVMPWAACTVVA